MKYSPVCIEDFKLHSIVPKNIEDNFGADTYNDMETIKNVTIICLNGSRH